ncbi:unnamed protein product [Thlaspi arvense]|uniref:Adaptor AP-1 19 kDa protein n=1 Tax=Thlaspi arvense TaxID=13288 RepID=A0AAU9T0N9_THLAR|nr:unnamed protein product [Thlaspi arvense]
MKSIQFVLLVSRQGKVRLTKWYSPYTQKERSKVIRELSGVILNRGPKLCNFVEWRGYKVVYKRYASLYFCMCIDQEDNELEVLEIIHHYVEILDRYFGSVCELDLIFNFHKAYYILDELLIAGELQESSKKTVARIISAQDQLVEAAKEEADMADDGAVGDRRHRCYDAGGRRKTEGPVVVDSINSLPDVILQQILTFVPAKLAITTSLLSKRWRHVWCDTPSLSFDTTPMKVAWINETLARYTAPKIMRFHLNTTSICDLQLHTIYILDLQLQTINIFERWIEFVMSRHVEDLSLELWVGLYVLPHFIYTSSSVKQLTVTYCYMAPSYVSWTSLKNLSLLSCTLSDESMAKILSGCPILESLTLYNCYELRILDLGKSLRLRTLAVERNNGFQGPTQIVAPYVHCLNLRDSHEPSCTLADVSSLTEANLNICYNSDNSLKVKVVKMLEELQHVEKLTLGGNFLQILSIAELLGGHFPVLKVRALTLETEMVQYVIPGLERVLQNSPDLMKLTVHTSHCNTIPGRYLDKYLDLEDLNPARRWRSKDGVRWNRSRSDIQFKHLASFVKLMVKNTNALEKLFLLLDDPYHRFKEMVPTLCHNNKVSIAFTN